MIKVDGLTKRYARTVAVDNISFEVEKGRIVGFLGPNGAGKTTTMRILTCFLPPTRGTAEVAGFDVLRPATGGEETDRLPARNSAALPRDGGHRVPELRGPAEGDSQVARSAHAWTRCWSAAPSEMCATCCRASSPKGYRQRVGLAQAIIHNPDVLILDEPTAGLDPKQILETRQLIKSLAGDHTIILSTHILPEVEQTCEQVIIITKGKLVATDTVENLTRRLRGSEADRRRGGRPGLRAGRRPGPSAAGAGPRREPGGPQGQQRSNRCALRSGEPSGPLDPRRAGARGGGSRLEPHRAAIAWPSVSKRSSCN